MYSMRNKLSFQIHSPVLNISMQDAQQRARARDLFHDTLAGLGIRQLDPRKSNPYKHMLLRCGIYVMSSLDQDVVDATISTAIRKVKLSLLVHQGTITEAQAATSSAVVDAAIGNLDPTLLATCTWHSFGIQPEDQFPWCLVFNWALPHRKRRTDLKETN